MKRLFFLGLLLIFFMVATVKFAALFSHTELDPNNWMAELAEKHKRLDSLSGQRVIFIGDSSLAFGLDSQRLEQQLNIPVANMGLHGALGLPFYFQEVKQSLRSQDKVVLQLYYYPSQDNINEGVLCHALDFYPAVKAQLDIGLVEQVRLNFSCDIKRTLRFALNRLRGHKPNMEVPLKSSVFESAKSVFNPYGDIYDDLHNKNLVSFVNDSALLPTPPQDNTIETLNYYNNEFAKKDVSLVMVYPPLAQTIYKKNKTALEAYDILLRKNTNIKILNHPEDSVIEDKYFFDFEYHLNTQGKKVFTDYLGKLLK